MAKRGRKEGSKIYDDYLPQASATPELVQAVRDAADRDIRYKGSMGAFIRAAVEEKLARDKSPEPLKWDS